MSKIIWNYGGFKFGKDGGLDGYVFYGFIKPPPVDNPTWVDNNEIMEDFLKDIPDHYERVVNPGFAIKLVIPYEDEAILFKLEHI